MFSCQCNGFEPLIEMFPTISHCWYIRPFLYIHCYFAAAPALLLCQRCFKQNAPWKMIQVSSQQPRQPGIHLLEVAPAHLSLKKASKYNWVQCGEKKQMMKGKYDFQEGGSHSLCFCISECLEQVTRWPPGLRFLGHLKASGFSSLVHSPGMSILLKGVMRPDA